LKLQETPVEAVEVAVEEEADDAVVEKPATVAPKPVKNVEKRSPVRVTGSGARLEFRNAVWRKRPAVTRKK